MTFKQRAVTLRALGGELPSTARQLSVAISGMWTGDDQLLTDRGTLSLAM